MFVRLPVCPHSLPYRVHRHSHSVVCLTFHQRTTRHSHRRHVHRPASTNDSATTANVTCKRVHVFFRTECSYRRTTHHATAVRKSHTHPFNGPFSGTIRVSRDQKGKTNLDFTEARDSEWQWYQLGHMQVCTLLQTDNRASTSPLSYLQVGCPSYRPTTSVKALKALSVNQQPQYRMQCHQQLQTFMHRKPAIYSLTATHLTKVCRGHNWHSAGSHGRPLPALKYKHIF